MIISRIYGGLGNQLFQYAAAKALAHHRGTELKLDVTLFENYHLRTFDLAQLRIPLSIASPSEIAALKANTTMQRIKARLTISSAKRFYKEPHFHFDPVFFTLSGNVYLQGYFQSKKYFASIQDIVRQEFSLEHLVSESVKRMAESLRQQTSVAIHIRRGDYKNPEAAKMHGILPVSYYQKAIEVTREKSPSVRFYLFSDDPVAAKDALNLPEAETVSGKISKTHFEDLYLMSHCQHNIIANSSFSWWAAWLNNNPNKTVIAPKAWFNDGPKDTEDLLPESWMKI